MFGRVRRPRPNEDAPHFKAQLVREIIPGCSSGLGRRGQHYRPESSMRGIAKLRRADRRRTLLRLTPHWLFLK